VSGGVVLVTGASSGIGRALARAFAGDGRLVLLARDAARLEALADELSASPFGRPLAMPLDLSLPGAPDRAIAALAARGLHVDVLVNAAGLGALGPFAAIDPARQRDVVGVNLRAAVDLALLVLPGMIARRRGGVLNVASVAAAMPGPLMATYYATKAGLLSFSEALWAETRGTGVTVTALCPGPTRTDFGRRAGFAAAGAVDDFGTMDAEAVARAGYDGFRAGARVVAPGWKNRAAMVLGRLLPRGLVLAAVETAQRGRMR
jgi:hypothetical protein